MNIFEWDEQTPVTANNMNEMQNILNDNISEEVLDVYSTTEQVVGTWLGKPLYRVVVVGTSPSAVGTWKKLYGNNIKDIIKYGGHIASSATTNWAIPLNTNDTNIWFSVQSSEIRMAVDTSGFVNKNIEIWFEYTKTTDV